MAVETSVRALWAAAESHLETVRENQGVDSGLRPSIALVLFYAVEAALKACVLKRQKSHDTSALGDARTHDLLDLLKLLRAGRLGLQDNYRARSGRGQVALHELHEAWRYGVRLQPEDHDLAVRGLHRVFAWCEEDWRK